MKNLSSISDIQSSFSGSGGQKVAIVHDWLYGGGAEKVILAMHQLYPDAPIYTSYCTKKWQKKLDNKVITGYLNKWPFTSLRKFIPLLRVWWFEGLDLTDYDIVIISTGNGEAICVNKFKKNALTICYCHSPTHFCWDKYDEYLKNPGFGIFNWLARIGLKTLVKPLRNIDYKAAQKPKYFIANSNFIKQKIKEYYNRDSQVISPPVNINRFISAAGEYPKQGYVVTGRQVPYKRLELCILACNKLHVPLTIIGNGPEHEKLVKLAGKTITFVTDATDAQLPKYLASAEAYIFCAQEDFGIAPVEALAAGTPLIAYKAGGALDYVNKKTGIFFDNQSVVSVMNGVQEFQKSHFVQHDLTDKAQEFSVKSFKNKLKQFIEEKYTAKLG